MSYIKKLVSVMSLVAVQNLYAAEEGLLPRAEPIVSNWSYLTNSLCMSVFVSLSIALIIRWIVRKGVTLVPQRGQACIEGVIEGVGNILEPIVGKHLFLDLFPLLMGYFVFILIQNLSGLLPGIGSIGLNIDGAFSEIFRPMNADMNATLALALIANVAWLHYCVKYVGFGGLYQHNFGNKADKSEVNSLVYGFLFIIFFGVGLIESLSIIFRVVSLSFRLFGNVFGGENLLHNMYEMSEFLISGQLVRTDFYQMINGWSPSLASVVNWVVSKLGYFLPLPFYFLECLVSLVQSFVFTLLVAVYIGLICKHEDETPELTEKV